MVTIDLYESEDQLSCYIYNDTHKIIISHSQQKRICTVHINFDKHFQKFNYSFCHSGLDTTHCKFIYRSNHCLRDNKISLFKAGSHFDKYFECEDKKRGICLFFKQELDKILDDDNDIYPFNIKNINYP